VGNLFRFPYEDEREIRTLFASERADLEKGGGTDNRSNDNGNSQGNFSMSVNGLWLYNILSENHSREGGTWKEPGWPTSENQLEIQLANDIFEKQPETEFLCIVFTGMIEDPSSLSPYVPVAFGPVKDEKGRGLVNVQISFTVTTEKGTSTKTGRTDNFCIPG